MSADVTLLSMFLVGLFGSVHCLGMCGGIVGALTLGLRKTPHQPLVRAAPFLFAYNIGRIATYAFVGALAGFFSSQVFRIASPDQVRIVAAVFSGGFMVALGLYLSGVWPGLSVLERWGGGLWRRIEPLGRRFLPVDRAWKALLIGLVWGWLPCGMVYAALAWALISGDVARGSSLMVAFGIGTLPAMLAAGAAARYLGQVVRRPMVRSIAGLVVALFGVYTLFGAIAGR
jgi:uncharacterized protein